MIVFLLLFALLCQCSDTCLPLEIMFSPGGTIHGWHCIPFTEVSPPGWLDNSLCTNKPIGLTYINHPLGVSSNVGRKCVHLSEPTDGVWIDNYLCLSSNSNIELVWSTFGKINNMACILCAEQDDAKDYQDNYLCWKEHKYERSFIWNMILIEFIMNAWIKHKFYWISENKCSYHTNSTKITRIPSNTLFQKWFCVDKQHAKW